MNPRKKFDTIYDEYIEKLENVASKHNTTFEAKSIYDCIEKHNRYYICAVSTTHLAEHLRGHLNDGAHETLHDMVMNTTGLRSNIRSCQVLAVGYRSNLYVQSIVSLGFRTHVISVVVTDGLSYWLY